MTMYFLFYQENNNLCLIIVISQSINILQLIYSHTQILYTKNKTKTIWW